MNIIQTNISDLLIIEPQIYRDARGLFVETYNAPRYAQAGIPAEFVQDNLSVSMKGVVRGLHFQKSPRAQGKLVQVIKGSVLDVAVDLRTGSSTHGQWVSALLTEHNKKQFWIPKGFAHGFIALEDHTIFSYKCTDVYAPECDGGILWSDPTLAIDWQLETYAITVPIVSEKDQKNVTFDQLSPTFFA